ncbi:MAG TPA: hypothetical protein DDX85_11660 [Nitrospiraceae bacterium]|nr:hypothetical protein [Nitrospiraceae bacterium]
MISGIVQQERLEKVPADEIKNRRSSEAQKAEYKQQRAVNSEDLRTDGNIDAKEAVDKIQEAANLFNKKIHIEVEEELNMVIVKVIDSETEEVIRQIPPKELVELSKHAKDLKGLLINKEG